MLFCGRMISSQKSATFGDHALMIAGGECGEALREQRHAGGRRRLLTGGRRGIGGLGRIGARLGRALVGDRLFALCMLRLRRLGFRLNRPARAPACPRQACPRPAWRALIAPRSNSAARSDRRRAPARNAPFAYWQAAPRQLAGRAAPALAAGRRNGQIRRG